MPINVRAYSAPINISAAFTAAIDVFELLAATSKPLTLAGFEIGQTSEIGDAQEEMLTLILKRVTGAPTSGSGGGTAAFQPMQPNDAAAGATLETGNTTQLTGGTSVELRRWSWNVRQPQLYLPVPECRIILDAGTRLVLSVSAPADSISTIQGSVDVLELV
jgi:hypothetical protein